MGQSEKTGGSCRPPPHQRSQADSCTGLEYKRWAAPLLALSFCSPTELSEVWGWGEFFPLHKTQLRWLKSHIKIISTIGSPPEPSARKAGPCSFRMEKCYLCIIVANCLVGVRVQALSQESGYRGAAPPEVTVVLEDQRIGECSQCSPLLSEARGRNEEGNSSVLK